MQLPASLKSCRPRPSPASRSSLCRSTPRPRTTYRGFVCSAFRRDRSKKNSKRCSSKANEETQQNCDRTERQRWCRPTSDATVRLRKLMLETGRGLDRSKRPPTWLGDPRVGFEPGGNIGCGVCIEDAIELLGDVADVGRREDVVEFPEGMIGRQRLDVEYIDRRAGDPALPQRLDQGRLIDDWSP